MCVCVCARRMHSYCTPMSVPTQVTTPTGGCSSVGIESPGYTVIKAPGYQGNMKVHNCVVIVQLTSLYNLYVQMLEQRCLATEQCVGFTTRGEFKNQLSPFERWTSAPNGHGMFVAGTSTGSELIALWFVELQSLDLSIALWFIIL